ncbi:MAG: hypothetical protein HYY24_15590 [Verrucomicrobia bacterium]|nr:hypothetical protein [Verrucomicrobiota bacterium]
MKTPELLVFGLSLLVSAAAATAASNFKHIAIDGSFDDWAGVTPAYEDRSDATGGSDLKTVYLAHDDRYLYVRFTLYAADDPFTLQNKIFIDADGNPTTGYNLDGRFFGSELLLESGVGYQQKNGAFNEGGIDGLDWAAAPRGAATDFEIRISRQAKYAADGLPVFSGDAVGILLEAENAQYLTIDTAPDDDGLAYTLTPAPPVATSNSTLITLAGTVWRVNDTGADLGTAWREIGYDDAQAGWTSGSGLFGYTANAAVYPAPIQKPLAADPITYYFRARFQWINDSVGVVLVLTNYLSDGAVFYLNGAEVKRVRLPSGAVMFTTPATSGPANPGRVELVSLPTAPLVLGENTLAVELHQAGGAFPDLVFGLSLLAATGFPVVITDPAQPDDRSVTAGDPTTFAVEFVGSPPLTFEWFRNESKVAETKGPTLTIAQVLKEHAGNYSLRISNPLSLNVTSRAAVLNVNVLPVRITDPSLPADQTVTEGTPVTFDVFTAGSPLISYQWFGNGKLIEGATAASYTIKLVSMADEGDYHVVVSNPAPSDVQSRTMHLTVNADKTAPTVQHVAGTPNKVTITFSERVTSETALAVKNYSLSSGLTVTAAGRDGMDEKVVVLTTSAQTLEATYTLTLNNVFDHFNNAIAPDTKAIFTSRIALDGSFDDWAAVPLAASDTQDSLDSADFKAVHIHNDVDYLYLRVSLHSPSALGGRYNNFFFDGDNDARTGYVFRLGSEMLVQAGVGFQEKGGSFNEGGIIGLAWAIAPEGAGTEFECRVSRHASYQTDGKPVFTSNTVAILLEAENLSYVTRDTAPDVDTFVYTFQAPPVTDLGPLSVRLNQGQVILSWPVQGKLGSRQSLQSGAWEEVPQASSPFAVQPLGTESYYRLSR